MGEGRGVHELTGPDWCRLRSKTLKTLHTHLVFPYQAAWFNVQTGSGGLKCVGGDAEGTLVVNATERTVVIKVQGRNPVGLRGLLWGCLNSTIGTFGGIAITKEKVVCGACDEETSTRLLRRKIMKGRLDFICEMCDTRLPVDDLLPGALCTSHNANAATDTYQLLREWMKTPEKAKAEGKLFPGQKMAWRQLVSTYLRSFLPVAMHPEDSPPLLWLPQLSATGCVHLACIVVALSLP